MEGPDADSGSASAKERLIWDRRPPHKRWASRFDCAIPAIERAIRKLGRRIQEATDRVRIVVTRRTSAWRARTDLNLCQRRRHPLQTACCKLICVLRKSHFRSRASNFTCRANHQKSVESFAQKYSAFVFTQISRISPFVSLQDEGRWPSSRTRGEMRWTQTAR
jgi:hypothetical protein